MENKKYIDKVIGSLVRGTKIDYENELIRSPFLSPRPLYKQLISPSLFSLTFGFFLSKYCKNHFGLTKEETEYVWNQYKSIILNKIENGQ